jgi:hypothetical protein
MRTWLILIGWIIPTAVPAITQQVPPADLVPSLTAPAMLVNAPTTLRVTLSNQGSAFARTPWVRFYMSRDSSEIKWATLVGATNAACTQQDRKIDCQLNGNLNGGSAQQIALNMRVDDVAPSNRYQLHIHADCGPPATHHNGGAIRESNEANNLIAPRVTIHRPPDLHPVFMSSSYRNETAEYVYKNSDTTLTFVVEQRENYVSTRNVNVRISTPNLDVKRVSATVRDAASRDIGSQGFICTWSNKTRSVSCLNGALGPRARVSIQAVVRGTLFAPSGNSPVIVSADPERRINEWSETNNTATYVVRIQ